MHPSQAHDVVEQRIRQRLDEAAAQRLGRRPRNRRNSRVRSTSEVATDEPVLRKLTLVTPCTT